jgi:hybrid cluster-associated redox disulfide protein
MNDRIPKRHHTVDEVMRRWPQTVAVFMQYRMACAGCPVGAFHSVEEAALEYRIPLRIFLSELRDAAAGENKRRSRKQKFPPSAGHRRVRP